MPDLPAAVLFACTRNSVRSPMAEAQLKHLLGHRIHVDSTGVRAEKLDPFVIEVMDEIGIDMTRHRAKSFDELRDGSYDLIVSLSPDAQHKAVELTRSMACELEYWDTFDPTLIAGNRETRLQSYRMVRDSLRRRIEERFTLDVKPNL